MQLSVIIPCYNATNVIKDQLHALAHQGWEHNWEIIISDNGSNPNLKEIVDNYRDKLPPVSIVDAKEKKGAAYARNAGARNARGKYLVFVDADDVVGKDWIKHIGIALEQNEFVASRLESSKLNPPDVLRTRSNSQGKGLLEFSVIPFLPFAVTSGLGIRKEIHNMVDGFDEEMKYVEDAEYCWKIQLAGYPLHFAERAVVHYRFRETVWQSFKQAKNYGEYYVLLYKKYQQFNIPKQNRKKALKEWREILKEIPTLHKNTNRAIWLRKFGDKLGRLKGSIKFGIFVP